MDSLIENNLVLLVIHGEPAKISYIVNWSKVINDHHCSSMAALEVEHYLAQP